MPGDSRGLQPHHSAALALRSPPFLGCCRPQLEVDDMCRVDGVAAKLAKLETDLEDAERRKAGEIRWGVERQRTRRLRMTAA